jgi:hypothetical protein
VGTLLFSEPSLRLSVLPRVWLVLALRLCVDLEWDLLLPLFFSLANETEVAPNRNKVKIPDMKVLMLTSAIEAGKIAAVPK